MHGPRLLGEMVIVVVIHETEKIDWERVVREMQKINPIAKLVIVPAHGRISTLIDVVSSESACLHPHHIRESEGMGQ